MKRSLEKKGIDLRRARRICASVDINGPLANPSSVTLVPYPMVVNCLRRIKELGAEIFINTGWDEYTVRLFDEKRLNGIINGMVCEGGNVFRYGEGPLRFTGGRNTRPLVLDLFNATFETCSESDFSFADQGNLVNACFYHENESGLVANICREGKTRPSAKEFAERLKEHGLQPKVYGGVVRFENSQVAREKLHDVLASECKLLTVRTRTRNDKVEVQIEGYNDRSIGIMELQDLGNRVLARYPRMDEWRLKVNPDLCFDYVPTFRVFDREINKAIGLHALIDEMSELDQIDPSEIVVFAIGDGLDDATIRQLPNALFAGLNETKAERDCDFRVSDFSAFVAMVECVLRDHADRCAHMS